MAEEGRQPKVRLFKLNGAMCVETICTDPQEFLREVAGALAALIEEGGERFEHDWDYNFEGWLPNIVEVANSLKGYKADVTVVSVVRSGDSSPSDDDLVYPIKKER